LNAALVVLGRRTAGSLRCFHCGYH
jgi:hypothetical protein